MYRATTPKQSFIFGVNPDTTFKTILITYAQKNEIILEKGKEDLTFTETENCKNETVYEASFYMTQEESNLFAVGDPVTIQVRALTYDGEAVASDKASMAVRDVLNDGVLT